MRTFRKTLMTFLVLATASSTLLASTPYYVCRCPNGTVKIFCNGTGTAESSCCISKNEDEKPCCRGHNKTKSPASKSCCNAKIKGTTAKPGDGPTLDSASCQKTLIQPDVSSVLQSEARLAGSLSDTVGFIHIVPTSTPIQVGTSEHALWQIDKPPPPTDLVTVFQRFTI